MKLLNSYKIMCEVIYIWESMLRVKIEKYLFFMEVFFFELGIWIFLRKIFLLIIILVNIVILVE